MNFFYRFWIYRTTILKPSPKMSSCSSNYRYKYFKQVISRLFNKLYCILHTYLLVALSQKWSIFLNLLFYFRGLMYHTTKLKSFQRKLVVWNHYKCLTVQVGSIHPFPAGKIAEKAMWRSIFLTIWHRMLNADSTKTPSSSVTF